MSWLLQPTVSTAHHCDVPGERSACFLSDFPEVVCVTSNVQGALWVCDCGQHWQGRSGRQWWPISARAARRALRRASRIDR